MPADNIHNEVVSLLTPYANEMEDERLGVFLSLSVGRILLKNNETAINENDLRHITDWLKASIINNEKWIANLDTDQRPKKLMKFSSIGQIMQEANKSMLINAQKLSSVKLVEGDEEFVAELKDGYYFVRLLTPEALDRESAQMQHCIGQGGYDDRLKTGKYKYLSLRDPAGKAHVTIETEGYTILQIQGKQNEAPIKKYQDLIAPYLAEQDYYVGKISTRTLGYAFDLEGNWHDIYNLPEGVTIQNSLDFSYRKDDERPEINLPDNLNVLGNLMLSNANIKRLPNNMKIGNNFTISGCDIEIIPEELVVGGVFEAANLPVKTIPESIKVGKKMKLGNLLIENLPNVNMFENILLYIHDCNSLRHISDGMKVKNLILTNNTALLKLPKGLKVKKDFELANSPIVELPECMEIGGNIILKSLSITELPKNIKVKKDLIIFDTDISEISHLQHINGSLDISNNKIIELPNNLHVVDDLRIDSNPINKLPHGLYVEGRLSLKNTNIDTLPLDIRLGSNETDDLYINMSETPIEVWPEELKNCNYEVILSGTKKLKSLPKNFIVEGELDLAESNIEILPEGIKANGLSLISSKVKSIPNKTSVRGCLFINDTDISCLPDDIIVEDYIYLDKNQIEYFPDSIPNHVGLYIKGRKNGAESYMTVGEFREKNNKMQPRM